MSSNYLLGIAAVVGMVTAAGMFIYDHLTQTRRRHAMAEDLTRLGREVCYLQKELEQLRGAQQRQSRVKCKKKSSVRSVSSASNLSSYSNEEDSSDLEFYDFSDDESTSGPSLEKILRGIDNDLNSIDAERVKEAYDSLNRLNVEYPNNSEVLWHTGKACYKLLLTTDDATVKEELMKKGIEMCEAAVNKDPNIAEAHKWLAILIGVRTNSQTIQGKINDGFLFKKHIDIAVTINPKDATLHHMLGQFTYESANLKWYERKIAATLFSDPPNGTFDEALDHFISAEKLQPSDWKENKLMMGKCLIALGRYGEAVNALELADRMSDSLDGGVASEVKVLLKKLNSYR